MRCFIAIPIDTKIKELLQNKVRQLKNLDWSEQIRWFPAKNLHLTIQFLGAKLENKKIEQVINVLEKQLADNLEAFSINLQKLELFPGQQQAHTVIAAIENSDQLRELAAKVNQSMAAIGLEKTRMEFRPHISLGRLTKDSHGAEIKIPPAIAQLETALLEVNQLTLFKSQLTNQAPIYTILKTINLSDRNNHES